MLIRKRIKMNDIYSNKKRSEIMAKISGKETKPEKIIRSYLFQKGFRYRKNDIRYPGKPDIVLPKYNAVIFINGCFWHGHKGCNKSKLPTTRIEFWKNKIEGNIARDIKNYRLLKEAGWNVIIVWECEIKNKQKQENRLKKLDIEIQFPCPF